MSRILQHKGSPVHGEQEQMQVSQLDGRVIWQTRCHHMETQHPVLAMESYPRGWLHPNASALPFSQAEPEVAWCN